MSKQNFRVWMQAFKKTNIPSFHHSLVLKKLTAFRSGIDRRFLRSCVTLLDKNDIVIYPVYLHSSGLLDNEISQSVQGKNRLADRED